MSSFSAGYGAVREILKTGSYRDRVDGVLAADSLYASTAADGTPLDAQMAAHYIEAALADRFGLAADQVLVTAGADDALDRACRAFLAPDRAAVR